MAGRDSTAAFKNEIDNAVIKPRLLIEAEFSSGTVNIWSGIGNLSWDSKTWTGVGELLAISQIDESVDIKVDSITITFQGITAAYKALALDSVDLDNDVTVYMALLDSSDAVVADPEIMFKGKMDEVHMTENGETAIFELTVMNRLAVIDRANEVRYTNQEQQELYSTDTGLRHIVNAERETKWGSTTG